MTELWQFVTFVIKVLRIGKVACFPPWAFVEDLFLDSLDIPPIVPANEGQIQKQAALTIARLSKKSKLDSTTGTSIGKPAELVVVVGHLSIAMF